MGIRVMVTLAGLLCVSTSSEALAMDLDELYVKYFSLKHFLARYETGYREQLSDVIEADEDSRLISVAMESRALSSTSENALNQAYKDFCAIADFNKEAEELAIELDDITRSFFLKEIDRANAVFEEFSPGAQNALQAVLRTEFELPIKAGKVGPSLNSVVSAKADPDGFKARLEAGCKYFK